MKTYSTLRKTGVLTLLFFISTLSYSQDYRGEIMFGLHGIYGKSIIRDLSTTIIPEPFFINYTDKEEPTNSFGGGVFVNYRSKDFSLIGGQLEAAFVQQGGKYVFNNTEKDFNYEMDFRYQYISTNLLAKIYPVSYDAQNFWCGINIAFGLQVNSPVSSDNIYYKSGGTGYSPAFGSDLEQQQQLRNVLKARTNMGLIGSIGHEFAITLGRVKLPMTLDIRKVQGITDAVETYPNSYNFVDNFNRNNVKWQVRLGFFLNTDPD